VLFTGPNHRHNISIIRRTLSPPPPVANLIFYAYPVLDLGSALLKKLFAIAVRDLGNTRNEI